jgi:nitrous oxidase accessory protein
MPLLLAPPAVLAAIALAVAQGATASGGRELQAGPGGTYASAGAALAVARPGDTVRLMPGTHTGPLILRTRGVTVTGSRAAIVHGQHRGTVVTVAADSVVLEGFVVRASGRSLDHDDAAVKLERCVGCTVRALEIRDPLHGIYLLESDGVTIHGNDIVGAADLAESARGNGIHLFNSMGNSLRDNRIRGTRDGMYFSFASGNLVTGNAVTHARYGLHYMYSDDNRFERNAFAENAAGAAVMFSKRIVLRENVFARHVGYRAYGLLLHTGEDILAEGNRFEGNLTALFMDGSLRNTFRDNLIAGNGVGIDVLASAEQNIFTGNVFRHNRTAVRRVLGAGENEWSLDGRGNDWGDPAVFDLDRDEIGDRPYHVGDPFVVLAASRPALEVYGGTLAARALSWAEEAFPVFGISRVVDPSPLAMRRGAPPATASWGTMLALVLALGLWERSRRARAPGKRGRA